MGDHMVSWAENFRPWTYRSYMGVSLNGGTPKTPPKWSCLVGKPMVVGYHHFRKPPYIGHKSRLKLPMTYPDPDPGKGWPKRIHSWEVKSDVGNPDCHLTDGLWTSYFLKFCSWFDLWDRSSGLKQRLWICHFNGGEKRFNLLLIYF